MNNPIPDWFYKYATILNMLEDTVNAAIAAEREGCAKACENLVLEHPENSALTADQCAAAIRARHDKVPLFL
jgi:hypothetical protein